MVQIIHPLFYFIVSEWDILIFLIVIPGLDSLRHLTRYLEGRNHSTTYSRKRELLIETDYSN